MHDTTNMTPLHTFKMGIPNEPPVKAGSQIFTKEHGQVVVKSHTLAGYLVFTKTGDRTFVGLDTVFHATRFDRKLQKDFNTRFGKHPLSVDFNTKIKQLKKPLSGTVEAGSVSVDTTPEFTQSNQ